MLQDGQLESLSQPEQNTLNKSIPVPMAIDYCDQDFLTPTRLALRACQVAPRTVCIVWNITHIVCIVTWAFSITLPFFDTAIVLADVASLEN